MQKQLSGGLADQVNVEVVECENCVKLRRELAGLERELADYKEKARATEKKSKHAFHVVDVMKKQLEPWHSAMSLLFDEIDKVEGLEGGHAVGGFPRVEPKHELLAAWLPWQRKLPTRQWQFIESLVEHGPMTAAQMSAALGIPRKQTIFDLAHALTKVQLIRKDGDKYALKEL